MRKKKNESLVIVKQRQKEKRKNRKKERRKDLWKSKRLRKEREWNKCRENTSKTKKDA